MSVESSNQAHKGAFYKRERVECACLDFRLYCGIRLTFQIMRKSLTPRLTSRFAGGTSSITGALA